MKRIAFTLAASLIGFSAFAADFQQKPVDFNNGQLGTYPAAVQGKEPQSSTALMAVGLSTAKNSELAAYPWAPTSGTMMKQMAAGKDSQTSYRSTAMRSGTLING